MNEKKLTLTQLRFLRRPVRCSQCGIIRQRQTMIRDKYGYLICADGCDKRVLHDNEEWVKGMVKKIKVVKLNEFN